MIQKKCPACTSLNIRILVSVHIPAGEHRANFKTVIKALNVTTTKAVTIHLYRCQQCGTRFQRSEKQ